jgi:hypothetical protein
MPPEEFPEMTAGARISSPRNPVMSAPMRSQEYAPGVQLDLPCPRTSSA